MRNKGGELDGEERKRDTNGEIARRYGVGLVVIEPLSRKLGHFFTQPQIRWFRSRRSLVEASSSIFVKGVLINV